MSENVTRFVKQHQYTTHYTRMWTDQGYAKLRTYLGMISKGQPKIWTAPFAKGQSMTTVMKDWKRTLESIRDPWPSLWAFENDLANKVGPLSVQLPLRRRMPDIEHYYEDVLLSSNPIDPQAVDAVVNEWRKLRGLRVRSQANTLAAMKKSTNSGNPWFAKKRDVVQDIIPCEVWHVNQFERRPRVQATIQGENWGMTATVGWRGQEGGPSSEDVKQRVVWMFPFALNLSELQVYQPLIEGAQHLNLVPAWVSMESVDRGITGLFDSKSKDDLIVCTDFSKFDQHFNQDLQDAAHHILSELLSPDQKATRWIEDVFPCKYIIPLTWKASDDITTYFVGRHGMASGSGGTNVDETLTHRSLQFEVAMHHNAELNPNSMCLGDDGILSYPGITVEDVVESYSSHGQECNTSKQYSSTQDCVYLRRWHHINYRESGICVGVYSTCRALGRLRYLERFMDPEYWTPEMVALRQLSIIENCNHHPLFEQFVQFCMKRDKYRLGIDLPGFLDNLTKIALKATGYVDDFLGYTKTLQGEGAEGISNWRVVKYLKSQS
nr:MAG: putative RNA-dependent RNA polymerase [Picobirnavirus sp.]